MSEDETPMSEAPLLGPDFAARVMRRADAARAGRRRAMLAGAAAIVVAVTAGTALWPRPLAPRPVMAVVAPTPPAQPAAQPASRAASDLSDESGALTAFFPDAPPLARFVERYSAANSGLRLERGGYSDAGYRTGSGGF
jgi:hypothetical protein